MGLTFPNPIGVAAGFDRYGDLLDSLVLAGFGFVEIGTINLAADRSSDPALNRVLFNLQRFYLRSSAPGLARRSLVGVSVGSLRPLLDEECTQDYLAVMRRVGRYADYFVFNLSRPGSPGRAAETDKTVLRSLLTQIQHERKSFTHRIPIMVKVAFEEEQHEESVPAAAMLAEELGYEGIVAAFEDWSTPDKVSERITRLGTELRSLPIIAVGGVDATTAGKYLTAGAAAVQVYTALMRHGPRIARRLCQVNVKFRMSDSTKS